jgi:hypothetical protein
VKVDALGAGAGLLGLPAHRMDERRRSQESALYFRTYKDQSIHMVDLKEAIAAAKGQVSTIDMETSSQPIANVSGSVKSLSQASN